MHCSTLLELYHQTQKNVISENQQVNSNPIKTYPFAFNQYNLDDEKPVNLTQYFSIL